MPPAGELLLFAGAALVMVLPLGALALRLAFEDVDSRPARSISG